MAGTFKEGHINKRLSDVSFKFPQEGFAASAIFTDHPVDKGSDEFTIMDKGNAFKNADDTMSKMGQARVLQYGENTDNYSTKGRAFRSFVSSEDMRNADDPLMPRMEATEDLTSAILLQKEIRAIALIATIANSTTPGTKWNAGGSTPVADIEASANTVFLRPNLAVIGRDTWDVLKFHSDVLALIGGGFTGIKKATPELFRDAFEYDQVIIAGSRKNAAKDPNTPALSRVWADQYFHAFVNPAKGKNIQTFGRFFTQKLSGNRTFQVREIDDPLTGIGGGLWVQVEHSSQEKIILEEFGAIITDTNT